MMYKLIILLIPVFLLVSCDDEERDYRDEYIGTYDCVKSNRSFEDDEFTTEIELVVILDSLSDNSVIVNDITIPIDENGRFETGTIDNDYHDLDLADDKIRWEINVYFPLGLALPCYIRGEKRN